MCSGLALQKLGATLGCIVYMAAIKRLKDPKNRNWKMNFIISCSFRYEMQIDFPVQTVAFQSS